MWELRAVCQPVSVKPSQAFADVLQLMPNSQMTAGEEGAGATGLPVWLCGTNCPFSNDQICFPSLPPRGLSGS